MAGMCFHMNHALGMEEVVGEGVGQVVMRRLWKGTRRSPGQGPISLNHQTFFYGVCC